MPNTPTPELNFEEQMRSGNRIAAAVGIEIILLLLISCGVAAIIGTNMRKDTEQHWKEARENGTAIGNRINVLEDKNRNVTCYENLDPSSSGGISCVKTE